MKLETALLAALMTLGLSLGASAGVPGDSDADLVPDFWDGCLTRPDGPNDACNQVDSDADGYGNACDTDYNNDGDTTVADFGIYFPAFTGVTPDPQTDHNCDGRTTVSDFGIFFQYFADPSSPTPPGPSGLPCAGTVPCVP